MQRHRHTHQVMNATSQVGWSSRQATEYETDKTTSGFHFLLNIFGKDKLGVKEDVGA